MFPCARHVILYLLLVQARKRPDMTENFLTGMGGSRGGTGVRTPPPPPLKITQMGFLSNTGPEPLKISKLLGQNSMLGHHGDASETPFKWRFAGEAMMAQNITTNKQNQLKITKETLISIFCCSCVRLLVHRSKKGSRGNGTHIFYKTIQLV